MDIVELKPIIEAMIFVSEEPITESGVMLALSEAGIDREQVRECLDVIERDWNEATDRGIQISQVAGGYQFRTKPKCADWLRRLSVPKPMRISGPALETLAIVAYKQPIVRSELEKIRGVDSGGVLKTLLERHLLRIVGRRDEPGQPLLYGTTKEFLEVFNLKTLKELPTLKDVEDLLRERRAQTDSKKPDGVEPAEFDDEEQTEVIGHFDDEEEEETEVIHRYPLDENEEVEKKDMEALSDLDRNLKDLRRLERTIFPKPLPEMGESTPGGGDVADALQTQEKGAEDGASALEPIERSAADDEAAGENTPAADDRPVE